MAIYKCAACLISKSSPEFDNFLDVISHLCVHFYPYELPTVAFGSLNTRKTEHRWREGVKEENRPLKSSEFLTVNNYKLAAV